MPDPHCPSCCPVEPPKPDVPVPWPVGALLWLGILAVIGGGGYLLVMWAVSHSF